MEDDALVEHADPGADVVALGDLGRRRVFDPMRTLVARGRPTRSRARSSTSDVERAELGERVVEMAHEKRIGRREIVVDEEDRVVPGERRQRVADAAEPVVARVEDLDVGKRAEKLAELRAVGRIEAYGGEFVAEQDLDREPAELLVASARSSTASAPRRS